MTRGWRHRKYTLPPICPAISSGGQQGRLVARQRVVNQCGGRSVAVEVGKRTMLVPAHTVLTFM